MRGSVDGLGRPLLRLVLAGKIADSFLATVDTGFNGELLMDARDAASIGIEPFGLSAKVKLGDGSRVTSLQSIVSIVWFGQVRDVSVHITDAGKDRPLADEPIALIGTSLLAPDVLEINFGAGTVQVRKVSQLAL